MVGMDCGHFYDLTNMGFSSSVHVGAWMVYVFASHFIFVSFFHFSFSSYILHEPFSCLVSFRCYFRGTFSGFLGFLGGRPVWFILLFSLLNGFGHLTG